MRLTEVAQHWIAEILTEGDIVIDATLGNGFDALFLAQVVGGQGKVYGFDVQPQAIQSSSKLLQSTPCQKVFHLAGHETMQKHIPQQEQGQIKSIMFNLGWLPNSNKNIITHPETTLFALEQAFTMLATKGRLSVMLYPGHEGGDSEAEEAINWAEKNVIKMPSFSLNITKVPNRPNAPMLMQIEKVVA